MERCPICGGSFRDKEWICSACGYDASADWMRYPTFVYLKTIENVNLKKKTESTMSAQEVQQQVQKRIQKIQTEKREIRERVHRKIQTVQNQMRSESLKAKSEEVCFQKDEEPSYYDELLEILNGHEEVTDKKNSQQETSLQEEQGYYDELLAILNKRR